MWVKQDKTIIFEGAQGSMLDIDHGTYPFVTSSSTTAGGLSSGLGIGPKHIDSILGITKAYTTRVGEGPFPTELFDANAEELAKVGHEFGATTGRPRRCGWLDLKALESIMFINSVSNLCITKLDVLDGFKDIKVCIDYDDDEQPVYKTFAGWREDTSNVRSFDELPEAAQNPATLAHLDFAELDGRLVVGLRPFDADFHSNRQSHDEGDPEESDEPYGRFKVIGEASRRHVACFLEAQCSGAGARVIGVMGAPRATLVDGALTALMAGLHVISAGHMLQVNNALVFNYI